MTAIHYGLEPVGPCRLYDQPEPKLKLTPRTAGAVLAVAAVYAGGLMLLNLAGIEFVIPDIREPKTIQLEPWDPPAMETPAPATPTVLPTMPITTVAPAAPVVDEAPVRMVEEPTAPMTSTAMTDEPVRTTPEVTTPPPQPPAPPVQASTPLIRNPTWLTKPTAAQLGRLYPDRAAERGVRGAVTMECRVTAEGSVAGCLVLRESPMGYGFGEAALKSTRYFRLNPRTVDGQAMEGAKVQIPMGFNLAE